MKLFSLLALLLCLSFAFPVGSDEAEDKGPRFDYYKLRGKKMRHGLLFQGQSPRAEDEIKFKAASAANGKKIYQASCIHCHGVDGKGGGEMGDNLVVRPADLSKLAKSFPAHHFFMQISEGAGRDMPAWEDAMSVKEIWDLVKYIKTLD